MSKDTGGRAFPGSNSSGMSLRDYFAGQALPQVFAAAGSNATYDGIARDAYQVADAMLRERER